MKVKTSEQLQKERLEKQKQKIQVYCEVTENAMNLVLIYFLLLRHYFILLYFMFVIWIYDTLHYVHQYKDNVADERALAASKKVLEMNTEHYTLWNYRRQVLEKWAQEKYAGRNIHFGIQIYFSLFLFLSRAPTEMEAHYKDEMAVTAELIRLALPLRQSIY